MHIVSWNVAGLSTTLAKIDADYGPSSIAAEENMLGDKKKRKASHAFEHYLKDLHQIDILAVQEHKIPLSQLSSRNDPYCVSMLEEYESFWCCNTDHKAKGMNGVCTFAKKGTVVRANAAPLGRPELDKQGRCIMTDHSFFVLFNVYVPCTNNGNNKMEFLEALQAAMSAEREKGRHVILVGDLNIAHKPRDRFWKWRPVCIEKIFEIASQGGPNWAMDVKKNWPQVEKALKTREVVPRRTTNVATKTVFQKFQVRVTTNGKQVCLGKAEATREEALIYYDIFGEKDTPPCEIIISVDVLLELMQKVVCVGWSLAEEKAIAESDAVVWNTSMATMWLNKVIEDDGMVDAFRRFYPNAEARFTVWHQYTNRRYENEGSRIDYSLVDEALAAHMISDYGESSSTSCALRSGGYTAEDTLSEDAALCAATANGGFQPASFNGGGITSASQKTLDSQFGQKHTGIVYTPPSYSDHVAVSLLLSDDIFEGAPSTVVFDDKRACTKKAQPHKSQSSIADFFGKKNRQTSEASKKKLTSSHHFDIKKRKTTNPSTSKIAQLWSAKKKG